MTPNGMKTARLATHVIEFAAPVVRARRARAECFFGDGMDDLRVEAADRRGTELHHES
jgi:alcohol dehydrogenase class IV